jgi:superfamily II DNA or RNA helicase
MPLVSTADGTPHDIDFLRNCFSLAPQPGHKRQTFLIPAADGRGAHRLFCSCCRRGYADCAHARMISELYTQLLEQLRTSPQQAFADSSFARLLAPIARDNAVSAERVHVSKAADALEIRSADNTLLCTYYPATDDRHRFLDRLGIANNTVSRRALMLKAARFAYSDSEKIMEERGHKTTRQAREQSFWYALAYHCFRECSGIDCDLCIFVDKPGGGLCARIGPADHPLCVAPIPARAAAGLINRAREETGVSLAFRIMESPAELLFRLTEKDDSTRIEPVIVHERTTHALDSRHVFGSFAFVRAIETMFPLTDASIRLVAGRWHTEREVPATALSAFLEKHGDIFSLEDTLAATDAGECQDLFETRPREANYRRLTGMRLVTRFDWVEVLPRALRRNWCWISAHYGAGDTAVSLAELLRARRENRRYVTAGAALIDCHSPHVAALADGFFEAETDGEQVRISRAGLFRVAPDGMDMRTGGRGARVDKLRSMMRLAPAEPLRDLFGLKARLRRYQHAGVQWLLFLYDNQFGGLLCDDMGLGKTHQTLGLIVAVREQRGCAEPALVVCPTTVISHWARIIRTFAPGLRIGILHGAERDVAETAGTADIILTSYGVMRNDIKQLRAQRFSLAVFDEIQNCKNAATRNFQAASRIRAASVIGLTGTPVENRLLELRTLFELVMPGYLGGEKAFIDRFERPIETRGSAAARNALKNMIRPFVLRRRKESVLDELPEKIEDVMLCALSSEQVGLYRESIRNRGTALARKLRDRDAAIPYMHIFALLNLLKRICDHPALISGDCQDYQVRQSGKWDLFCELLDESLDSERKVVVFTQYRGMIDIMDRYLAVKGVDHELLTGSSTDRGAIVERFNTDPACRVIVVSLLAGGVGIDLIGASVVIHYDRWWNAAREDQATDRVHRIGQKRAVQVFKLISEGTLEEKIAAIIEKKKSLADELITEDSPDSLKQFTRDDLLSLLEEM